MASFTGALGVLVALLAVLGSALSAGEAGASPSCCSRMGKRYCKTDAVLCLFIADVSADASQGWLAHMAQTSDGEDTLSELTATFFGAIPDALTSNTMVGLEKRFPQIVLGCCWCCRHWQDQEH